VPRQHPFFMYETNHQGQDVAIEPLLMILYPLVCASAQEEKKYGDVHFPFLPQGVKVYFLPVCQLFSGYMLGLIITLMVMQ